MDTCIDCNGPLAGVLRPYPYACNDCFRKEFGRDATAVELEFCAATARMTDEDGDRALSLCHTGDKRPDGTYRCRLSLGALEVREDGSATKMVRVPLDCTRAARLAVALVRYAMTTRADYRPPDERARPAKLRPAFRHDFVEMAREILALDDAARVGDATPEGGRP